MTRSAAARAALALAVLVPLLVLAALAGLSLGAGNASIANALRGVEPDATLVFRLRLPRVLLADLGIENAAQELTRPFARLSVEAAVQAAPDVLVLAGVDPPKGRPVVPGLDRVPVAPLRSQALLHPGPRLVEALDDLEAAVRGAGAGERSP